MLPRLLCRCLLFSWILDVSVAWSNAPFTERSIRRVCPSASTTRGAVLSASTATDALNQAQYKDEDDNQDNDDEDEEEYEYVEYDMLKEVDFSGSEWLIGSNLDNSPRFIDETWVRMAVDKDGKNIAIWGDGAKGKWAFDVASQFLSFSKENLAGKKIWAGVVDDYYFVQGTIRGWTYWSAAAVLGQWQARRLGVDKEEAGIPPWFEQEDEGDNSNLLESRGE